MVEPAALDNMKESTVEEYIRKHLKGKGWKVTSEPKRRGQHGVDIKAYHPKWCKRVLIEVKGGSGKHKHQEIHNSFYNVMGQVVARMDIEGNRNNRENICHRHSLFLGRGIQKKIMQMKFGWKLLRLRTYLVKPNGAVIEKPYSYFLKK